MFVSVGRFRLCLVRGGAARGAFGDRRWATERVAGRPADATAARVLRLFRAVSLPCPKLSSILVNNSGGLYRRDSNITSNKS